MSPLPSREERGSALVELVWVGIILLVPLVWVVIAVAEVQAGAFAVSSGARSAARAFALAETDAAGEADARAAVRQAFVDQDVADQDFTVDIECGQGDCHVAGEVITVRLRSAVDLPLLPRILGGDRPRVAVDASHTVPVGQFRDLR